MRRTEIKVRKGVTGEIEIFHPARNHWITTGVSKDTQLGSVAIPDIETLIKNYMDADEDFLRENEWDLRIDTQSKIGRALWQNVFGDRVDFDLKSWIHFSPLPGCLGDSDFMNFFCRVPWMMMTRGSDSGSSFLALNSVDPVAITLEAAGRPSNVSYDIKLPSAPKLLLVMPQVTSSAEIRDTEAKAHEAELRQALESHYADRGASSNIRTVRSFDEFIAALQADDETVGKFDPHIIYFYGHGSTPGGEGTQFLFEENGVAKWKSVDKIALIIRDSCRWPVPLIWFNACSGAAANDDSALRIFSQSAACVVAMRTVVRMKVNRELATKALRSIIIDGFSPPVAVREIMRKFRIDWTESGHWASIVIAAQFTEWTYLGDQNRVARYNDAVGNYPMRVDRAQSLASVQSALQIKLAELDGRKQPVVIFWSGVPDQSPRIFEERVKELLIERFPAYKLKMLNIELQCGVSPEKPTDLVGQLRDLIMSGLTREQNQSTADTGNARIIQRILNESPGRSGVFALLHGPLSAVDMPLVQTYIGLWRGICGGLNIENSNAPHIVLAFGFDEEVERAVDFPPEHAVVRLGAVPPSEIRVHLERYVFFYGLNPIELDERTSELNRDSGGAFQILLKLLEKMAFGRKGQ